MDAPFVRYIFDGYRIDSQYVNINAHIMESIFTFIV